MDTDRKLQLVDINKEIEENRDAISVLESHNYNLERRRQYLLDQMVVEALPSLHNVPLKHDLEIKWGCNKSPTGLCAFNDRQDPLHEDCLFCHRPLER